jgi:hypothetical protein
MNLTSLRLTSFPSRSMPNTSGGPGGNLPWDADSAPDLFLRVVDEVGYVAHQTEVRSNASGPQTWTVPLTVFSVTTSQLRIVVYDSDGATENYIYETPVYVPFPDRRRKPQTVTLSQPTWREPVSVDLGLEWR